MEINARHIVNAYNEWLNMVGYFTDMQRERIRDGVIQREWETRFGYTCAEIKDIEDEKMRDFIKLSYSFFLSFLRHALDCTLTDVSEPIFRYECFKRKLLQ